MFEYVLNMSLLELEIGELVLGKLRTEKCSPMSPIFAISGKNTIAEKREEICASQCTKFEMLKFVGKNCLYIAWMVCLNDHLAEDVLSESGYAMHILETYFLNLIRYLMSVVGIEQSLDHVNATRILVRSDRRQLAALSGTPALVLPLAVIRTDG